MDFHERSGQRTLPFPPAELEYGSSSHIGRRPENQDAVRLPTATSSLGGSGVLFAVADGMGGHRGGCVASRMACDGLIDYHRRVNAVGNQQGAPVLKRHLEETFFRTDRTLRVAGMKDPMLEEMGTTLSCLLLAARFTIVAHVGDSRIYRLRGGHLQQLTVDHTFVQDMIIEGELNPRQARRHPFRHMLTRVVGAGEPLPWVDTRIDGLRTGDSYLLSTDGLHGTLGRSEMKAVLCVPKTAQEMTSILVASALESGASDNVTAVVIKLHN